MGARRSTGIDNLDRVLGGDLEESSTIVLAGAPGTGKTVLAQQLCFALATEDAPALYITTLSESQPKLVRHLQDFEFFDSDALGSRVRLLDMADMLGDADGLEALVDRLTTMVVEERPSVLVVDSAKALRDGADATTFRASLHRLVSRLSYTATTMILVGEYVGEDLREGAEFAVADGIIQLTNVSDGPRDRRYLRVRKLRGQAYLPGQHSYAITNAGANDHPRLETITEVADALPEGRASVGVPALDDMLHGGLPAGDATLVSGPSGAGKTVLGLHFIRTGLQAGERCIYVTLEESAAALRAKARSFGWPEMEEGIASGQLVIREEPILELDIDRVADELAADLAQQPGRFVFDSLGELTTLARREQRHPGLLWALANQARSSGASVLFTLETTALGPGGQEDALSHLFHNVVLLRYLARESEIRRMVTVLKMRDSDHAKGSLEFTVTGDGITPGESLSDVSGLLGWSALAQGGGA